MPTDIAAAARDVIPVEAGSASTGDMAVANVQPTPVADGATFRHGIIHSFLRAGLARIPIHPPDTGP